ncbi:maleylacetoacetate isomerase [Shewanella sp. Isolate11]|uniref:maleylacetoacetate isomerase n=1 Tax=Shewanella sp. Isolate11 TaxID=2908530 RepID=UPI001EFEE3D1|nr:maleylacetoacetate isomerase [Shewanella sp. Isolate11]MCG9698317.1 maleylacetoacetate isomerase [Shewanella sp. Isolate11]
MKLLGYWRSSAAYRVRIALNLKGIDVEHSSVHLVKEGGEQHKADYAALNPHELVPTLIDAEEDLVFSQSLAMIEYLEERYPQAPLLPSSAKERALVRAMALSVACEIHPLNNLRVLQYLTGPMKLDEASKTAWYHHWIHQGFAALEKQLEQYSGRYCFGDNVTLVDLCLIPQVYNANRFAVDLTAYPHIRRIWDNCHQLEAFVNAAPEQQADAC